MAESPSELRAEIEKLERKHAGNPEGRYFVPLANDYRKLGDLARAEELLREGLRKHPDYLSAHIVLGRCLADREKRVEAADEFTFVLSMDPQNLIALRSLGELALADGRREEAARWYRELLAVDPMNDEARQALAEVESPAQPVSLPGAEDSAAWWDSGSGGEPGDREPDEVPAAETEVVALPQQPFGAGSSMDESADENRFGRFVDLDSGDLDLADDGSELPEDRPAISTSMELGETDEPADDIESVEVVTETIAELYARQGLRDRAIGVYRELIRRRGGDPALERRLAELESSVGRGEEMPARSDSQEFAAAELGSADLGPPDWEAVTSSGVDHQEGSGMAEPAFSSRGEGDEVYGDAADLSTLSGEQAPEDPVRHAWMQDLDIEEREDRSPAASVGGREVAQARGDADTQSDPSGPGFHDPFADSFETGFTGVSPQTGSRSERPDSDVDLETSEQNEEQERDQEQLATQDAEWSGAAAIASDPRGEFVAGLGGGRSRTIGEYLAALAAWTPGADAAEERSAATPSSDAAESEPPTRPEEQPDTASESQAAPAAESGWGSEPFPWELPAQEDASPPAVDGQAEASSEEPEDIYSSPAGQAEGDEHAEGEPQIGLEDYFPEDAAAPSAEEPGAGPEASRQDADQEDDDLESFQAWLRSLKR